MKEFWFMYFMIFKVLLLILALWLRTPLWPGTPNRVLKRKGRKFTFLHSLNIQIVKDSISKWFSVLCIKRPRCSWKAQTDRQTCISMIELSMQNQMLFLLTLSGRQNLFLVPMTNWTIYTRSVAIHLFQAY